MCDTVVATGEVTIDGSIIFGKNSDREPNEAHQVVLFPAQDYAPGNQLQCTHISIPQVTHTFAVLLAKPFWIWGAEMGANEWGVVIGNEAVFTKIPDDKQNALLGMDLLRLGLERASTAPEAVTVITSLLAEHGQGGNHGLGEYIFYHNSFLIADPQEAWVLETAGSHWAAKRVQGVYAISNALSIEDTWDLASPTLVTYAIQQGWCEGAHDFNFARCYGDGNETDRFDGYERCKRATDILSSHRGEISIDYVMTALRDHGVDDNATWAPEDDVTNLSICMHAGPGEKRVSQTTGSMVSHLKPHHPTHFLTGTAAPCSSVFIPLWLDCPLPYFGPEPQETFNPAALFWQHEHLHRQMLFDYSNALPLIQKERDELEKNFVLNALEIASHPIPIRTNFTEHCFSKVKETRWRWLELVSNMEKHTPVQSRFSAFWKDLNDQAQVPI